MFLAQRFACALFPLLLAAELPKATRPGRERNLRLSSNAVHHFVRGSTPKFNQDITWSDFNGPVLPDAGNPGRVGIPIVFNAVSDATPQWKYPVVLSLDGTSTGCSIFPSSGEAPSVVTPTQVGNCVVKVLVLFGF